MLEDLQERRGTTQSLLLPVVRGWARTGLETRNGESGGLPKVPGVLFLEDWKEYFP